MLLSMLLESPQPPAVKNIILASQVLELDEDFVVSLLSAYDEYHRECPNNDQRLTNFEIENFQQAMIMLPPQVKEKLSQKFFKELSDESSSTNRFNSFVSLFGDYQTQIEDIELETQIDQIIEIDITVQLRALATALNIHDDVISAFTLEVSRLPSLAQKKEYLEKLKTKLEVMTHAYQLKDLFNLPVYQKEYRDWIEVLIDGFISDLDVRWHMKNALETADNLKDLTSSESKEFQELKSQAQEKVEDESNKLLKLERERSMILRLDLKIFDSEKLSDKVNELKKESDWNEDDLIHEKIEKLKLQIEILKACGISLIKSKIQPL